MKEATGWLIKNKRVQELWHNNQSFVGEVFAASQKKVNTVFAWSYQIKCKTDNTLFFSFATAVLRHDWRANANSIQRWSRTANYCEVCQVKFYLTYSLGRKTIYKIKNNKTIYMYTHKPPQIGFFFFWSFKKDLTSCWHLQCRWRSRSPVDTRHKSGFRKMNASCKSKRKLPQY